MLHCLLASGFSPSRSKYNAFDGVSHLHSRADWGEGIHLREAHSLAVDSWRLWDHDGGAGLTLRPGGCWGVGWLGLIKMTRDKLLEKAVVFVLCSFCSGDERALTWVVNLGLNSLAFGFRVDFLT